MALGGNSVKHSLVGHMAPILEEHYVTDLKVTSGKIPPELRGMYLRNGGNPHLPPKAGEPFHVFQGDGMIHGVSLDPDTQRASYVNRWVRTPRFLEECKTGRRDTSMNLDARGGVANTALVFHAGKLLALVESHLPLRLEVRPDGDIVTCGFEDFGGAVDHAFTAHPKIDAKTGEMMFFGYNVLQKPFCTCGVVDASGALTTSVPVDYDKPVMIHDMAISENWTVLLVLPVFFDLKAAMEGKGGAPFSFDRSSTSRFAFVPRHAKSADEIRWFEDATACFAFHSGNAWEDEDGQTVHVVLCDQTDFDLGFKKKYASQDLQRMSKYSFHLPTGATTRTTIVNQACDFPTVNPRVEGHRSRFNYPVNSVDERVPRASVPSFKAYAAENQNGGLLPAVPLGWSLSKIDVLKGGEKARIVFGHDRHVGEVVFVPKRDAKTEDAGYLITFLHDAAARSSSLAVFDAETMSAEPVCLVELPTRIPFGFHGLWLSEAELRQQASWSEPLAPRAALHRSPAASTPSARL